MRVMEGRQKVQRKEVRNTENKQNPGGPSQVHVSHFLLVKGGPRGMNALTLAGCVSTSVSSFLWGSEKPEVPSLTGIKPKRK